MHPLRVIVLPCIQDELELIVHSERTEIRAKYLTTLLSQLDEELELNVCADRLTTWIEGEGAIGRKSVLRDVTPEEILHEPIR